MKTKKTILMLLAVVCLTACRQHTSVPQNDAEAEPTVTEEAVVANADSVAIAEFVTKAYADAFARLADEASDMMVNLEAQSHYLSEEMAQLLDSVVALGMRSEECILDYDIWLQAQDYEHPQMQVLGVSVEDETRATADILITDGGDKMERVETPVQLKLIKENGQWKIDDMIVRGEAPLKASFLESITAFRVGDGN